jgi:hypothetical protein
MQREGDQSDSDFLHLYLRVLSAGPRHRAVAGAFKPCLVASFRRPPLLSLADLPGTSRP